MENFIFYAALNKKLQRSAFSWILRIIQEHLFSQNTTRGVIKKDGSFHAFEKFFK